MLRNLGLPLVKRQIIRVFIDSSLAGAPLRALLPSAPLFLANAIVQQGISILAPYQGEALTWTATNALRGERRAIACGWTISFHNSWSG